LYVSFHWICYRIGYIIICIADLIVPKRHDFHKIVLITCPKSSHLSFQVNINTTGNNSKNKTSIQILTRKLSNVYRKWFGKQFSEQQLLFIANKVPPMELVNFHVERTGETNPLTRPTPHNGNECATIENRIRYISFDFKLQIKIPVSNGGARVQVVSVLNFDKDDRLYLFSLYHATNWPLMWIINLVVL